MEFAPAFPPEGQLVKIPLLNNSLNYVSGTLALATGAVKSATQSWASSGISYAELEIVGVEIELTTHDAGGAGLPGIELTAFAGDGQIPALYGTQQALAQCDGSLSGLKTQAAVGHARLVVIGLRDKAGLSKTQTVRATTRVFAFAGATGTLSYLASVSAILNTRSDPAAEQSV
jgi:hypothetical protein